MTPQPSLLLISPILGVFCRENRRLDSCHRGRKPHYQSGAVPMEQRGVGVPVNTILVTLQPLQLLSGGNVPYSDHCIQWSSSNQFSIRWYYSSASFSFFFCLLLFFPPSSLNPPLTKFREDLRATEVIPASIGPCSLCKKSSILKSNTQVPFSISHTLALLSPDPETRNRPSREKSRE